MKAFIVLCMLNGSFCLAQNPDFLWKVNNNKKEIDTNRLKALNEKAWILKNSQPDTAIAFANKVLDALQMADSIETSTLGLSFAASARYTISRAYSAKAQYPFAIGSALKALKLYEEISNKPGIAKCNQDIGLDYFKQKNYENAFGYLLKALQLNKDCGNHIGEVSCYYAVGTIYAAQKKYKEALECDFNGLRINRELHNKQGISIAFNNIGEDYRDLADEAKMQNRLSDMVASYKMAREYYLKALKLDKEMHSKQDIDIDYLNLALACNSLSNYKTAILYGDSSLKLCKEIGDADGERLAYEALAEAYSKINQYKKAYESYVAFKTISDDMFVEEVKKKNEQAELQCEYDKKELIRKAQLELKNKVQEALKKQSQQK